MGNSNCMVVNKTHKKICLLTFNQADLLYGCDDILIFIIHLLFIIIFLIVTNSAYVNMYVLEPGESLKVESATADPIGLKLGIIYEADTEVNRVRNSYIISNDDL